jgi:hypothetical protein
VRIRHAAVLFAVFSVLAAAVTAYVIVQRVGDDLPIRLPVGRACTVTSAGSASPETVTLDAAQTANAATISAVGLRRKLSQRAIVVALATALQESKLENLAGGDRDSIGLFQQRPSQGWGTPEQIADPRYAANAFYTALLKVQGWEQMRVTDAAQAVQRSAHPELYEKWADESEVLARALTGEATSAVACTISGEPESRGPTAVENLVSSVKLDWGTVTTAKVTDFIGMALTVREAKVGWQYAHWLVAHAEDRGVKRVRFNGREWTAKTGAWASVTDGNASNERVVAEVYGP